MNEPDRPRPTPRNWVLHVDMDQFLVSVELLRRPELAGRPVVVGGRGDPSERAVVSTCSYEARAFGVRSGMPLRVAVRRCPQALFLPLDTAHYQAASARVMATLRAIPGAVVEVLGWDEAFLGIDNNAAIEPNGQDAEAAAHDVRRRVAEATGLPCSVGIGDTLVRAKTATAFGKLGGVYRLTEQNWLEVMGDRPTTALWGVGNKFGARLGALGIATVADLAAADVETLIAAFGPSGGAHLSRLGRGGGRAWPDDSVWVARAHGHEETFQSDLTHVEEVRAALQSLAERVVVDLRAEDRPCARVHLKTRFAPFLTFARVRKLAEPTYDAEAIAQVAWQLFARLHATQIREGQIREGELREGQTPEGALEALGARMRPVRLLGIRAEMTPPEGGY